MNRYIITEMCVQHLFQMSQLDVESEFESESVHDDADRSVVDNLVLDNLVLDNSVRIFGKLTSMFPSIVEVFDDEEDFMAYVTGSKLVRVSARISALNSVILNAEKCRDICQTRTCVNFH